MQYVERLTIDCAGGGAVVVTRRHQHIMYIIVYWPVATASGESQKLL
jgi:hypothetical protein